MKYFFAIFIPPVAVFGCGKFLQGILNAILSAISGVFLLSGFALALTPLVEATGTWLLPLAVVLWLAACTHALRLVIQHSNDLLDKEEQIQLLQQLELMREAAAKQESARQLEDRTVPGPPPPPQPQTIPQP